ncbi:alpha/beta hydrolase family protein [Cupriavidus basilensis]
MQSNRGRDKLAIFEFDPQTAQEGRLVFRHDESRRRRPWATRVTAGVAERRRLVRLDSRPHRHCCDARARADPSPTLGRQLPEPRAPTSPAPPARRDPHASMLRVEQRQDRSAPATTVRQPARASSWSTLGKVLPLARVKLDAASAIPRPDPVSPRATACRSMATLTLPVAAAGEPAPAGLPRQLVNPHGGPWTRDDAGASTPRCGCWRDPRLRTDAADQLPRLSITAAAKFLGSREASKQWGRDVQHDIDHGEIDWLVAQGIAWIERMAIFGGSYGGLCDACRRRLPRQAAMPLPSAMSAYRTRSRCWGRFPAYWSADARHAACEMIRQTQRPETDRQAGTIHALVFFRGPRSARRCWSPRRNAHDPR